MDTQFALSTQTAEEIVFAPLQEINVNRYQHQEFVDQEQVIEIAKSLQHFRDNGKKGLLQVPVARRVEGGYEEAFGRHRLLAFRYLVEQGDLFFNEMPLVIQDLSDQEMFELMAVENLKRRDLNPIEKGRIYSEYMTTFNKTSVEAAEKFGGSPESIRSLIRLLNLPKDLQADVADGTITQNNARRLITIQRTAPQQLKEVAKKLKSGKAIDPDTLIANTLKNSSNSVQFYCPSWRVDAEPMAGQHLWPLRLPADKFPRAYLPEMSVTQAAKVVGGDWTSYHDKGVMQNYITWFRDGGWPEGLLERINEDGKYDRLQHLINPPACTACPFYAKVNGDHYCTFKDCFDRKKKAWEANELAKAVKALGIAEYDRKVGGPFVMLVSYSDAHKKLVKEKSPDLRLKKANSYADFDGVPEGYAIVAVGKTAEKLKQAEDSNRVNTSNTESYRKEQERLNKIREANSKAIYDFLWSVATKAFLTLYTGKEPLEYTKFMADRFVGGVPEDEPSRKASKKERLEFYQREILFQLLNEDLWDFKIDEKRNAVRRFAKRLQGQATAWGVKLPKNWMDQATQADKAITVTTETAETE